MSAAIDIAALRALLEKATKGRWTIELYGDVGSDNLVIHSDPDNRVCFMATPGAHSDRVAIAANARLIVFAKNDLPSLLTEVEELREALRECGEHKEAPYGVTEIARAVLSRGKR